MYTDLKADLYGYTVRLSRLSAVRERTEGRIETYSDARRGSPKGLLFATNRFTLAQTGSTAGSDEEMCQTRKSSIE